MNLQKTVIVFSVVALLSGGVASPAKADGGRLIGTLLGAAGGAAVGSNMSKGKGRTVAIAAGTLIGAGVGNSVSRSVDRGNSYYYRSSTSTYPAAYYPQYPATPTYARTDYVIQNQPGYFGSQYNNVQYVSAGNNFQETKYCREFLQNVTIGGETKSGYGIACRQPDGSWEIQN